LFAEDDYETLGKKVVGGWRKSSIIISFTIPAVQQILSQ
jgi:hypothetical protein